MHSLPSQFASPGPCNAEAFSVIDRRDEHDSFTSNKTIPRDAEDWEALLIRQGTLARPSVAGILVHEHDIFVGIPRDDFVFVRLRQKHAAEYGRPTV